MNLTDEQTKQALQCHSDRSLDTCTICPLLNFEGCAYVLSENALNLINRQKAEIERLQERDETAEKIIREQGSTILSLQDGISRLNDRLEHCLDERNKKTIEIVKLHHEIQGATAETIKEFAKLLIDKSKNGVVDVTDIVDYAVGMVGAE